MDVFYHAPPIHSIQKTEIQKKFFCDVTASVLYLPTDKENNECIQGKEWTVHDAYCYSVVKHNTKISWSEARRHCENTGQGSHLASIRSQADMDFVHKLLVDAFVQTNETKTYIGKI